MDAAVGHR